MSHLRFVLPVVIALAPIAASCAAASSSPRARDQSGSAGVGGASGANGSAGVTVQSGFGNSSSQTSNPPPERRDEVVDPNACQSTGRTAEQGLAAVDIVWVIDGSGSMVDEAQRVQDNIDSFVASISAAGVDTRVVLIAQGDLVPPTSALAQSGNYRFVSHDVDSHNALESIIERFPDYSDFLRPNAHVNFIVVTDDESQYGNLPSAAERGQAFRNAFGGLSQSEYSVHAVVSPGLWGAPPCQPMADPVLEQCCTDYLATNAIPAGCDAYAANINPLTCPFFVPPFNVFFLGGAAANGETYSTLARDTGGVEASICMTDWTPVFSSLSDAVIESAPLPCNYAIPQPPSGMTLDTGKVNVKYAPPGTDPNSVMPWGNVADASACGNVNAWYFDNPVSPTEVLLCPAACDIAGSGAGGTIDVLFGCATIRVD